MLRFIFFILVGYFVYRGLKSLFAPRDDSAQVKGRPKERHQANIDRSKIEDAHFKDIED